MKTSSLKIVKLGNRFLIVSGKSELWKGPKGATEFAARLYLQNNRRMLEYWAGSASVSIHNSKWVTVEL